MPPGYCRVSDEDDDGPFRFGQEASAVVDTSRRREMSVRSRLEWTSSTVRGYLERVISAYVTLNTQWFSAPIIWILILALAVGMAVLGWQRFPPHIDVTLGSFEIPDQRVSREYDAMNMAIQWGKTSHSRRSARATTCCTSGPQTCPKWKFDIVYLPTGGGDDPDNIFTRERLTDIHKIEMSITEHPGYANYCWIKNNRCVPVNSLLTYFYPTLDSTGHPVSYDGMGSVQGSIEDTLKKAMTSTSTYWYVDSQFGRGNFKSGLLRSEVTFARPLKHFEVCPSRARYEQESSVAADYMVSFISLLEKASTENVKVLFGGGSIYDYEVKQAVLNDSKLAIVSLCLIVVLVFILTSFSPYLTLMGILCVVESFPITYIIYRVFYGIPVVGILNVISLFVIVGIGVDDVFVFINTFRLSREHGDDVHARMMYTLKTAGRTTLFTSVTTATAFFANLLSELPAVHDFGLFMGWLVVVCYLVTLLSMPPVLYIWWLCDKKCPTYIYLLIFGSKQDPVVRNHTQRSSEGVNRAVSNGYAMPMETMMNGHAHSVDITGNSQDDDDDPPLPLEDTNVDFQETSDKELLREQFTQAVKCMDVTNDHQVADWNGPKRCSLFFYLHLFISKYLSRWIVRSRFILFVIYLVVLCVSCGLVSKLQTAKKPPQFFPSDSNLQQLIDIGYNLTNSDKSGCWMCSGYFNADIPPRTTVTQAPPLHLPTHSLLTQSVPRVVTVKRAHPVLTTPPPVQKTEEPETKAVVVPTTRDHEPPTTQAGRPPITKLHKHPTGLHGSIDQPTSAVKPKTNPPVGIGTQPNEKPTAARVTSSHQTLAPYIQCPTKSSCIPVSRPASGNDAIVYVVFGILDIDRSQVSTAGHVLSDDLGDVVWDKKFSHQLGLHQSDASLVRALCDICLQAQDPQRGLVVANGANCFSTTVLHSYLGNYNYCEDMKLSLSYPAQFYLTSGSTKPLKSGNAFNGSYVQWLSMAFQSTTFQGKSSFDNVKDYDTWNDFLNEMKAKYSNVNAIQSAYQTSSYWVDMFRETMAVSSAIYGIVLSSVLCMGWVMIFTGHVWLLVVVFMSIAGTLLTVLALMHTIGWTFGAVEAVTLSVLVGTSVDYIVHLVESFAMSAKELKSRDPNPNRDVQNRVRWAFSHIGISILSSAVTTVAASIPLCFTEIQLFAKFGQILLLNTAMSITYALTACASMLSIFAGLRCCYLRRYGNTCTRAVISFFAVGIVSGQLVLVLYIVYSAGRTIPGPDGESLF